MGRLVTFVTLTFLVSWSAWFGAGALAPATSGVVTATDQHGLLWWTLIYVGTFAPALIATALTAHEVGKAGLSALYARLVQGEIKPRWYLFALLYMPVIKLVVALVYRSMNGAWPAFTDEPIYLLITATLFSTILFTQSGEELGWRGFLLPRLASKFGYAWAGILVGVVWATWHRRCSTSPAQTRRANRFRSGVCRWSPCRWPSPGSTRIHAAACCSRC